MSSKRYRDRMAKLDECHRVVLQNSARGIRTDDIAEKLGKDRTTIYDYLNSLELTGKVRNEHGLWFAKTEDQSKEKEIVIELPMPKKEWQRMTALEFVGEEYNWDLLRVAAEKLRETRTIRIKGKNVDDLDLEKIGKLIQQANENSLKASLRGLFKSLKRSHTSNS